MEEEYKGMPHVILSSAYLAAKGSIRISIIDPANPDPDGGYRSLDTAVISPEEARDLARWIGLLVPPK